MSPPIAATSVFSIFNPSRFLPTISSPSLFLICFVPTLFLMTIHNLIPHNVHHLILFQSFANILPPLLSLFLQLSSSFDPLFLSLSATVSSHQLVLCQ